MTKNSHLQIQNSYVIDYFLRILYGISKAITEQIKVGDEWSSVKKVISINTVYFDLGRGKDYIYRGTTTFSGLHENDTLELSNAQKKLFKKEKVRDLFPEIYLLKVNNFDDNAHIRTVTLHLKKRKRNSGMLKN